MSDHACHRQLFPALAAWGLAITGLSACNPDPSICDIYVTDSQCPTTLTVTVAASQAIARVPDRPADIDVEIEHLLADSNPQVELGSPPIPLSNLGVVPGVIHARLADSTVVPAGHRQLTVKIGTRTGQTAIRVYTPPVWGTPLRKTYDTASKKQALQAFIGKQPFAMQNSLYIAEEDASLGVRRQVVRYAQGTGFTAPEGNLASFTQTSEPTALFGLSPSSVLTYYFDNVYGKKVVKATDLTAGTPVFDILVNTQNNTPLFASDPQGLLRLLVSGLTMEAFLFDGNYAPAPLASPPLTSNLSLLTARHVSLDGQRRVDAVALDAGRRLVFYSQTGDAGPLTLNEELTSATGSALGSERVVALDLFDLDGDGYMDVVMALADQAGNVQDLGWLPYLGNGAFAPLLKSSLPTLVTGGLHSMALGDLAGDAKPDLVLATAAAVFVFTNQAP